MTPGNEEARPVGDRAGSGGKNAGGGHVNDRVTAVAVGRHDWRALWEPLRVKTASECRARRARVLAYPDLAERLTQPPLNYSHPNQWNGFVPPRFDPDPRPYRSTDPEAQPVNTSPRRAALVEIAAEALRREQETGTA